MILSPQRKHLPVAVATTETMKHAGKCTENAEYLHEQLRRIGYFSVWTPGSTFVMFLRPDPATCARYELECDEQWAWISVAPSTLRFDLDRLVKELMLDEPEMVSTAATLPACHEDIGSWLTA